MAGRHLIRAVVPAVLTVALAVPAAPAGASGGDDATASVPADGAALSAAPTQVELTFSRAPVAARSHLAVVTEDGRRVNRSDTPTAAGRRLVQAVSIQRPGVFTIAYHVEFADGGEAQGSRRFSVGTGAPPPAAPVPAAAVSEHQHGVDPVSAVLLVVDGLVVLGAVAMLLRTRRPRHAGPNPSVPPGPPAAHPGPGIRPVP
ncbi:copper resistance CopC family protein [Micromonospora sp. NPDC007230]|uniref:copper resistance CopC family protein n=1 Tax=Micromonospora sp. NPDC007230 TaxID=3364237 RepID=UPI003696EE81